MEEAVAAGGVEAVAAEKAEAPEGAEASVIETKGTEEEQETQESLDACFSKLIRGEMKNPYEKAVRRETEKTLLQREQAALRERQRVAMVQRLEAEEARVKEVYPTFDLEREAGNPEFTGLLKRGVPMKKAFEVLHMDELMQDQQQ